MDCRIQLKPINVAYNVFHKCITLFTQFIFSSSLQTYFYTHVFEYNSITLSIYYSFTWAKLRVCETLDFLFCEFPFHYLFHFIQVVYFLLLKALFLMKCYLWLNSILNLFFQIYWLSIDSDCRVFSYAVLVLCRLPCDSFYSIFI